MVLFCRFLIILTVFSYFAFMFLIVYGSKYRNPYRLYMVFGKKGSGKTTLITKLAFKHLKRGWKVYSTVPTPGAYLFDAKDIGKIMFDCDSVVFCDEGGILFDNRNFKAFREDTRNWFKYQRHYRVKVYVFSQAFDIDVKLRNLTDFMYLTNCYFNVISVARRVQRKIVIVHPNAQGESRIADDMEFTPWFLAPFGGLIITWIPNWIKYFDSFDAPELEPGSFVKCGYPDGYFDAIENTVRAKASRWVHGRVERAAQKAFCIYWKFRTKWIPLKCYEETGDVGTRLPSGSTQSEETFDLDDYEI